MDFATFESLFLAKLELEKRDRNMAVQDLARKLEAAISSMQHDIQTQKEWLVTHYGGCQPPGGGGNDLSTLRSRVDELRAELARECNAWRSSLDHACVGAGFLAVAAAECMREDRAAFTGELQAHQDSLIKSYSAVLEPFPAWMMTWAQEHIQAASFMKRPAAPVVTPSPRRELAEFRDAPTTRRNEFTIEVDRSTGAPLGLTVRSEDMTDLIVDEVGPGLLADLGRIDPVKAVQPNDHIVEINGLRGNFELLAQEATKEVRLRITVRRGATTVVLSPMCQAARPRLGSGNAGNNLPPFLPVTVR